MTGREKCCWSQFCGETSQISFLWSLELLIGNESDSEVTSQITSSEASFSFGFRFGGTELQCAFCLRSLANASLWQTLHSCPSFRDKPSFAHSDVTSLLCSIVPRLSLCPSTCFCTLFANWTEHLGQAQHTTSPSTCVSACRGNVSAHDRSSHGRLARLFWSVSAGS